MCDMTYWDMWRDSLRCGTWLVRMGDMTRSNVWRDSLKCGTWLIHVCSFVTHDPLRCVTWLIHMCRSLGCIHTTWLIKMWDMTYSYVCSCVTHDSLSCVFTWLIHMGVHMHMCVHMTHSYDSRKNESCHTTWWVMGNTVMCYTVMGYAWLIKRYSHVSHMTH